MQSITTIVTGAAGFIGSNLIRALNKIGVRQIVAVDDLTRGDKFRNLASCEIADYLDIVEFREAIRRKASSLHAAAIYHQGACADTTESDGRYMMDNNYSYSKELLHFALESRVPFIYASSASVYGMSKRCTESPECEGPLNVYAYSKFLFDHYVRRLPPSLSSTVVGLRYFNVYGQGESHKGSMASMVSQLYEQLRTTGVLKLFEGTDGYAPGEQRRDFVFVHDVVAVNLHFGKQATARGIYNCGTGVSRSFNDIANILIKLLGRGVIQYIPVPETLKGKYQSFTEANIDSLRAAGYAEPFHSLEEGIELTTKAQR